LKLAKALIYVLAMLRATLTNFFISHDFPMPVTFTAQSMEQAISLRLMRFQLTAATNSIKPITGQMNAH